VNEYTVVKWGHQTNSNNWLTNVTELDSTTKQQNAPPQESVWEWLVLVSSGVGAGVVGAGNGSGVCAGVVGAGVGSGSFCANILCIKKTILDRFPLRFSCVSSVFVSEILVSNYRVSCLWWTELESLSFMVQDHFVQFRLRIFLPVRTTRSWTILFISIGDCNLLVSNLNFALLPICRMHIGDLVQLVFQRRSRYNMNVKSGLSVN